MYSCVREKHVLLLTFNIYNILRWNMCCITMTTCHCDTWTGVVSMETSRCGRILQAGELSASHSDSVWVSIGLLQTAHSWANTRSNTYSYFNITDFVYTSFSLPIPNSSYKTWWEFDNEYNKTELVALETSEVSHSRNLETNQGTCSNSQLNNYMWVGFCIHNTH